MMFVFCVRHVFSLCFLFSWTFWLILRYDETEWKEKKRRNYFELIKNRRVYRRIRPGQVVETS